MEFNHSKEELFIPEVLGKVSLSIGLGEDKWADGTAYSLILNVKMNRNNSSKRRRPFAFMKEPATDSCKNIQSLLKNIRSELVLLKQNMSALCITYCDGDGTRQTHCADIACFQALKNEMDSEWQRLQEADPNSTCFNMMDAELLLRATTWNPAFIDIHSIFILDDELSIDRSTEYIFKTHRGFYFLGIDSVDDIEKIHLFKRNKILDDSCSSYNLIYSGSFWNGSFSLPHSVLSSNTDKEQYILFETANCKTSIIYAVPQDGGDLDGIDHRYGFGSSSCFYFCSVCRGTDKHSFSDSGHIIH